MPGRYNFEFAKEMTYLGQHYNEGDVFETDDPCEVLRIMDTIRGEVSDASFTEGYKGVVRDALNECPYSSVYVTVINGNKGATNEPKEQKFLPGVSDGAQEQGAPSVPPTGKVNGDKTGGDGSSSQPSSNPTEEPRRPAEGEKHTTHNGELPKHQVQAGDPVDIFNGIFYIQETDLEIPGTLLPLQFTRYYRSGAPAFGPFGWNWDHNFNCYIRELSNGDIALWRNLHEETFTLQDGSYAPPCGVPEMLERLAVPDVKFEIKQPGGITLHFERPAGWIDSERIPVTLLSNMSGHYLEFIYGPDDHLMKVQDGDGHYFTFEYDECRLLVSVTDQAGRQFTYEHDEETMQLRSVLSPPTTDQVNGIKKIFHYEYPFTYPELRNNIIRIEDHDGRIYVENTYEEDPAEWHFARLKEQYYGGYLFQYRYTQLQWTPDHFTFINIPSLRVEVMNPDFGVETYTFNYRGDILDFRYRLVKDGSFRVVAFQYAYDEEGNLTVETKPDGSSVISSFDATHSDPRMRHLVQKKEITSASGFPSPGRILWEGVYNEEFQVLKEERNELGNVTRYKYDFDLTPQSNLNKGLLKEIHFHDIPMPDGTLQHAKVQLEYNDRGQKTAITYPDGTRQEITYGISGDERNQVVQQNFDINKLNIVTGIKYDQYGFPSAFSDGNGNEVRQVNNIFGLPEIKMWPEINGAIAEHRIQYDSDKKEIRIQKPVGSFTENGFHDLFLEDQIRRDVLGFPVDVYQNVNTSESREVRIVNDFRGNPVCTYLHDGTAIKKVFDERGLLISEKITGEDGLSLHSKRAYDRAGKLIQETDVTGNVVKYKYDGFSRLTQKELPNHSVIKYTWGPGDLLLTEEFTGSDGYGQVHTLSFCEYMYDSKGRKVKEIKRAFTDIPGDYTELVTTISYDNMNRILNIRNPYGGVEIFAYDGLGRLIKKTDASGNTETQIFDPNDNIIKTISQQAQISELYPALERSYTYDARNRMISMQEMDESKIQMIYDDRNLLVCEQDFAGTQKIIAYNANKEKIHETYDPSSLHLRHQWEYDDMSRIKRYTDPSLQSVLFEYDSLGRKIKTINPNGVTLLRKYNDTCQIESEEIVNVSTFIFRYDESHRLSSIENTSASASIIPVPLHTFLYDGLDRWVSGQAGNDIIRRKYDSIGRLVSESNHGQTITCTYLDNERTVIKTWPDGRKEKLDHNRYGNLKGISEIQHSGLGSHLNQIAKFNTEGPVPCSEMKLSDHITIKNNFDEKHRLSGISISGRGPEKHSIHYHVDRNNRRKVEQMEGFENRNSFFEYDNRFRLTKAIDGFDLIPQIASTQAEHDQQIEMARVRAESGNQQMYTYNLADSRTTSRVNQLPEDQYQYAAGHRMTSADGITLQYSGNGNVSANGQSHYTSDAFGRIVTITKNDEVIVSMTYDAFGRSSMIREKNRPEKSFLYFGAFVEQVNEGGVVTRQITSAPGMGTPLAYHIADKTLFPIFDGRSNLIALMDTAGMHVETYRYEVFGTPHIYNASGVEISGSAFNIEPVFGGQKYLHSAGLYLSKRRLMDPQKGIYLSPDPEGYADSASLYVYCAQNPVDHQDPDGDFLPFIAIGLILGGLGGLGFSIYDHHKNGAKYRGWGGVGRYTKNILLGAVVGATAIVAGEAIVAGGAQWIAANAVYTGATITASQAFVIHGTASVASGLVVRTGFHQMFPEYVDQASAWTVAADYFIGGGMGVLMNKIVPVSISQFREAHQEFFDWLEFWKDKGGATIWGHDDAFPLLNKPEEFYSTPFSYDIDGSWYARVSTQLHEWLHHRLNLYNLPARYKFTMKVHEGNNPYKLYIEELFANLLGAAGSMRPHAVLGMFETAENSLGGALSKALVRNGVATIEQAPKTGNLLAKEVANNVKATLLAGMGLIGLGTVLMGADAKGSGKK